MMYSNCLSLLLVAVLSSTSLAFQVAPRTTNARPSLMACNMFSFFGGSTSTSTSTKVDPVGACPPKSKNCIRTTWSPPAGSNKAKSFKAIKNAIEAYPQQGQNKIDLGGWKIVENDGKSKLRVEYTSGIGFFAKLANGGKPFVDDLRVAVDADGTLQLRSSSRVGESDLGVNQKRLQYLAKEMTKQGYTVPPIKY